MIVVTSTTITPPPLPDPGDAAPYRPVGLQVWLSGVDGSTWDLTRGPVRVQPGISGLGPGNVEHKWATSPLLPGGTRRGYTVPVRPLVLPVLLQAGGFDLEFRDLDAALWRALSPEGDCTLTVVTPDAEVRTLTLAFVGVGEEELSRDPFVMGYAAYPLSFDVGDYWRGATVTRTFEDVADPPGFFVAPGGGGVFALASDLSTDTATAANEGDVSAWPLYAVTGPVAGFAVGVGDSTIDYGAVPANVTVWIDTHPLEQTVGYARGENDESAWSRVTRRRFASIPPGAEVPIVVTLDGAGVGAKALVELTPRYRRAW